jgi:hypothetical protein
MGGADCVLLTVGGHVCIRVVQLTASSLTLTVYYIRGKQNRVKLKTRMDFQLYTGPPAEVPHRFMRKGPRVAVSPTDQDVHHS